MKKKNIIIGIIILILISLAVFLILSGGKRTDVFLGDFSVEGNTMTIKVGVSSSAGYVRKMKRTSGSMNYYFTFYSTFGINSKVGAKDTFEIKLDNNVDEIYFYTGNKGYKKVLEKNEDGNWVRASYQQESNIENISTEIYDISLTGATIIITDKNKPTYTYGEWYKIEKEENGTWIEVEPQVKNYGFNEIAYIPNDEGQVKFIIDWEKLYGELELGSYRIVKRINNDYIYISFGIATTS